jgi:hypothetical protein
MTDAARTESKMFLSSNVMHSKYQKSGLDGSLNIFHSLLDILIESHNDGTDMHIFPDSPWSQRSGTILLLLDILIRLNTSNEN